MIIGFEQNAKVGRTAAGATGAYDSGLITITKEVDRSSPILRNMLISKEPADAIIRCWTPQLAAATGTGQEVQYYTIQLKGAQIVGIKTVQLNNKNPELMKYAIQEEVTITYREATWTWTDGGITSVEKQ